MQLYHIQDTQFESWLFVYVVDSIGHPSLTMHCAAAQITGCGIGVCRNLRRLTTGLILIKSLKILAAAMLFTYFSLQRLTLNF